MSLGTKVGYGPGHIVLHGDPRPLKGAQPSNFRPMSIVAHVYRVAFSVLTLLVGRQEGHPVCKIMGGWWRWALVSPDGVVPSRMVCVSASVNLPLHHKVQKFSSGTGSSGWSRKKGRKTVVVWWCWWSIVAKRSPISVADEPLFPLIYELSNLSFRENG